MEKDGGRVEKQTKAKLCNGRVGGDVHAASGGVACALVYRDFFLEAVVFAVDLYLLVLVWASTLPLKSTWQLILGVMLPFLVFFYRFFCLY